MSVLEALNKGSDSRNIATCIQHVYRNAITERINYFTSGNGTV